MSHAVLTALGDNIRACSSAQFDGSTTYITRGADLTGDASGKQGIFSCWVRFDGGDGTLMTLLSGGLAASAAYFFVSKTPTNVLQITGRIDTTTACLLVNSTTSYTASAAWHHILASWDLSIAATNLYVDDVSVKSTTTATNNNIVYASSTDWYVGNFRGGGGQVLNGCLAELYWAPNQFLDFSVITNRRKFISSSLRPVYLGSTGSLPTGTAPLLYLESMTGANAAAVTNLGTGGNLTITAGAGGITTGSTSPSS